MSKSSRDKGKRGELRWARFWQERGFRVRSTDETGSVGHDDEIGADLELADFDPPLYVQCKELASNCPSPRGMLERSHVACIHFTEGSVRSQDVIIMLADVFDELARKAKGERGER